MNAGAYGGEMKDVVVKTEFCHVLTGTMDAFEERPINSFTGAVPLQAADGW